MPENENSALRVHEIADKLPVPGQGSSSTTGHFPTREKRPRYASARRGSTRSGILSMGLKMSFRTPAYSQITRAASLTACAPKSYVMNKWEA